MAFLLVVQDYITLPPMTGAMQKTLGDVAGIALIVAALAFGWFATRRQWEL